MYSVDHLIFTLLCQHYAGITKPPIMPKAMPAYCACPNYQVTLKDIKQEERIATSTDYSYVFK